MVIILFVYKIQVNRRNSFLSFACGQPTNKQIDRPKFITIALLSGSEGNNILTSIPCITTSIFCHGDAIMWFIWGYMW